MSELTKEEKELVEKLRKPLYTMKDIEEEIEKRRMLTVNNEKSPLIECKCHRCGEILHIHSMCDSNSPWIADCFLHKKIEVNKFKKGDECWFFKFPEDGTGGWMINKVRIEKATIIDYDDKHYYVERGGAFEKWLDLFKSKNEAIEAMIKRLNELREEEQ